jgi:hypothetical protein
MQKSNSRFIYLGFIIAGLMGFGTYGVNNTIPSIIAQSDGNMTGTTNMTETEHAIPGASPLLVRN